MRYVVACALLTVGSSVTPRAAQTSADYVPFRIVAASGRVARVDLGARADRAKSLWRATVVTPAGAVRARFVRTERVCEWLCGDGSEAGKECHFEAVLHASAPVDKALAVLPGSPDIRAIAEMPVGAERPVDSPAPWIEAEPIRTNERTFQWTRSPDGVFLSFQDAERGFSPSSMALADCTIRPVAPFTILSCPSAQLLYEKSRGIAISVADYGEQTVEPLLRFRLDGRDAVVIRLGLKGAVATALLMKGDDGLWRLGFRPFDYAQLC